MQNSVSNSVTAVHEHTPPAVPDASVSPNPTNGFVTVHGIHANTTHVGIANMLGQTMLDLGSPHSSEFTLDLSKLPAGNYFVRAFAADGVVTKMVVRE